MREKKLEIIKVKDTDNIADPFTKHVDGKLIEKNLQDTECKISVGRHEIMPEMDDQVECIIHNEDIEAGDICMLISESDNKSYDHNVCVQAS